MPKIQILDFWKTLQNTVTQQSVCKVVWASSVYLQIKATFCWKMEAAVTSSDGEIHIYDFNNHWIKWNNDNWINASCSCNALHFKTISVCDVVRSRAGGVVLCVNQLVRGCVFFSLSAAIRHVFRLPASSGLWREHGSLITGKTSRSSASSHGGAPRGPGAATLPSPPPPRDAELKTSLFHNDVT